MRGALHTRRYVLYDLGLGNGSGVRLAAVLRLSIGRQMVSAGRGLVRLCWCSWATIAMRMFKQNSTQVSPKVDLWMRPASPLAR